MLWTAIAIVMNSPSSRPPTNETPTPIPSAAEWIVMTPTIISALSASAPFSSPIRIAGWSETSRSLRTMNPRPVRIPAPVRTRPSSIPS